MQIKIGTCSISDGMTQDRLAIHKSDDTGYILAGKSDPSKGRFGHLDNNARDVA
jgi:hypothetical protein